MAGLFLDRKLVNFLVAAARQREREGAKPERTTTAPCRGVVFSGKPEGRIIYKGRIWRALSPRAKAFKVFRD